MIYDFALVLADYFLKIIPALLVGFFISGVVNESVSIYWVEKHLGKKGIKSILLSTIIGIFLPICCFGSLPVAVSLYKKGASLGAILGFLIATPATSITALIVCYILLGWKFTIFIFFAVIITGLIVGIGGNSFKYKPGRQAVSVDHCCQENEMCGCEKRSGNRILSILKFAFVDMPKDIGIELLLGIILAAVVGAVVPIGNLVESYLGGGFGFLFSLIFGIGMYFCSTASVPLVDAFISQGMSVGAGMVLLLVGPITSYGTILVLRKEFGWRILLYYLGSLSILSLLLGYLYNFIS
jgi:uncharacterized membrane protein YraQ (UPF0718 family)